MAQTSAPSFESPHGVKSLPVALSMIAGSTDVISFLGLNGLFTAHITGNLILIAAHIVAGSSVTLAHLLSVPVFILILGLTKLLATVLEAAGIISLRPLLLLHFLLLAGFLGLAVGPNGALDVVWATLAGMLGISAMAVQNALVQISLKGVPSTTVMTTNLTRLMMDVGDVLLRKNPAQVAEARRRAQHTWPVIVGFAIGAGLGAAYFAVAGLWALALPTGLALLALAMSLAAKRDRG
jgi:uncharacterized membrane protein YoaK (UPF0700 family)